MIHWRCPTSLLLPSRQRRRGWGEHRCGNVKLCRVQHVLDELASESPTEGNLEGGLEGGVQLGEVGVGEDGAQGEHFRPASEQLGFQHVVPDEARRGRVVSFPPAQQYSKRN